MENKNKNLWVVVLVVGVAVILVIWAFSSSTSVPVVQNNTVVPPVVSTEDTSTGSVDVGVSAASLSYNAALVKYANARIQLDDKCQADAQSQKMTFKNNALVMIDNRAPVNRTIHLGTVFPIKAYGFKIVKLYSAKLPVTWLLDCDASQNVATVTIQK